MTVRNSMLDESPTNTTCPSGASSASRRPADGPRAGRFCQFTMLPPEYRPVVLAPHICRYTGSRPRSDISTNRMALVSAMVVFTPRRAATSACTSESSCSSKSVKSLSLLANAHVSLPVVLLILVGGITPRSSSFAANLSLDMIVSRSVVARANNSSLRVTSASYSARILAVSPTSIGSVNMRTVMSMSFISSGGVKGSSFRPSSRHNHVSCLQ